MELTRERALQLHRRLWRWIGLKTLKEKRKVQKWEFPWFENGTHDTNTYCYCCEYASNQDYIHNSCENCPIDWSNGEGVHDIRCTDSLYEEWTEEFDYRNAAEIAFRISNLPERKEK